ncbi:hypothetical protein WKV44_06385 [Spirochaetia bacterium 38H-sp]|uniref:DUF4382 domain-containing protein n=1 Tax=Rarispira pelagica TaxID=3141764 RepID=A0ABU9UBX5_9SPIR
MKNRLIKTAIILLLFATAFSSCELFTNQTVTIAIKLVNMPPGVIPTAPAYSVKEDSNITVTEYSVRIYKIEVRDSYGTETLWENSSGTRANIADGDLILTDENGDLYSLYSGTYDEVLVTMDKDIYIDAVYEPYSDTTYTSVAVSTSDPATITLSVANSGLAAPLTVNKDAGEKQINIYFNIYNTMSWNSITDSIDVTKPTMIADTMDLPETQN